MPEDTTSLWSAPAENLARELSTSAASGLTSTQAAENLARFGPNRLRAEERTSDLRLLAHQFTNPIVLLLIGAAVLSGFLGDAADAVIIGAMVLTSGLLGFIRSFMLTFGTLSSVFDYATFAVLLLTLHASPAEFRTGWFTESVISASMVVLVIRTRRPFLRSRPSWQLTAATLVIACVTLALPYTPIGVLFKFVHLPARFYVALTAILIAYVGSAELAKRVFYKFNP